MKYYNFDNEHPVRNEEHEKMINELIDKIDFVLNYIQKHTKYFEEFLKYESLQRGCTVEDLLCALVYWRAGEIELKKREKKEKEVIK